jgi:CheY-like chemotaxis protein
MPKRILIVDDMSSMRMFLKLILKDDGFILEEAGCGKDALAKCRGATPPDLILMDVMMPEMDGLECCRQIKAFLAVPVIMVTTKGEEQAVLQAHDAGCDGYVTKPVKKPELMTAIRKYLTP